MSLEKQNSINQLDFIRMKRQSKEGIYLKYKKKECIKSKARDVEVDTNND